MNVSLRRFAEINNATLGALAVNGRLQCFALEDAYHAVKVPGQTRIPVGNYQLKLRLEGKIHDTYALRFPSSHRGMLWLQDVPNFEWIYLHCGNRPEDTEGCILIGDTARAAGHIEDSVTGYLRVYGMISNAILAGEPTSITVE